MNARTSAFVLHAEKTFLNRRCVLDELAPAVRCPLNRTIEMLERLTRPAQWIRHLEFAQPAAEQECFSRRRRKPRANEIEVRTLHHEDQVGRVEHGLVQSPRYMPFGIDAVRGEHALRERIDPRPIGSRDPR